MSKTPKKTVAPVSENGSLAPDAPHWRGDTAVRIIERRRQEIASRPVKARRASKRARPGGKTSPAGQIDRSQPNQLLRRLERNLKRRKTLAARQRLQKRIDDLRASLPSERADK
jgi:hypothetical protein